MALLAVLLLLACVYFYCKYKAVSRSLAIRREELFDCTKISNAIFENVHAYILLVSEDFIVRRTNYYTLSGILGPNIPKRVGELLHCKNAIDSGQCGTHELCSDCPVRNAIEKEFDAKGRFSALEVSLTLCPADGREDEINCDASVSGVYLDILGKNFVLLTIYDISNLKDMQQKLMESKVYAEEANRLKSAFLANMSHEIRTPLNAIVGFSGLLASVSDEEERKTYLDIIETNNGLLLQLIDDILDLSKIEAGTLEFNYSDVDLEQMMRDLEGVFKLRAGDGSLLEIRVESLGGQCYIHTEKNRVSQVLSNFLSNALKFTSQGSIVLGYKVRDEDVYFYVTDTGAGIPKELQANVFNRFAKLNPRKQGTGLGLAISQSIIERLGGTIGVDSELGEGSTFWFTLPVRPLDALPVDEISDSFVLGNEAFTETGCENSFEGATGGQRKILIAEDMEDNYLLYQVYLSKNYKLVRACNGEEAIALFLQENPDIILMDLKMPVVDGYQAVEAIRQTSVSVPIIAVTAFAYSEDKKKVLSCGFNDYLSKPIKKDLLFEKLKAFGL